MASPVSFSFTDPEYVIGTAVQGTASILDSALKFGLPTLKSFVYMSSVAAIFNSYKLPYTYTEADWNTESEMEIARLGAEAGGRHIYRASKTAGEKTLWAFKEKQRPSFAMTAINPVIVQGPPIAPPEYPAKLNETNQPIWTIFSGQPIPPAVSSSGTVDVRDVADLVVAAVDKSVETDGERYIAYSGVGTEQAVADILRAHYPARRDIIQVGEPGNGYLPGFAAAPGGIEFNSSKAAKLLERDWINYEQTVLDTAKALEKYL
jgi:nucleoside-diphosphate-sugar epimerase